MKKTPAQNYLSGLPSSRVLEGNKSDAAAPKAVFASAAIQKPMAPGPKMGKTPLPKKQFIVNGKSASPAAKRAVKAKPFDKGMAPTMFEAVQPKDNSLGRAVVKAPVKKPVKR